MHDEGNNANEAIDGQRTLNLIHSIHPVTTSVWQQVDSSKCSPEEEKKEKVRGGYLFA